MGRYLLRQLFQGESFSEVALGAFGTDLFVAVFGLLSVVGFPKPAVFLLLAPVFDFL